MKKFNITNLRKAIKFIQAKDWTIVTGSFLSPTRKECCPYTAFTIWTGLTNLNETIWENKDREILSVNPDFSRAAFVDGFDGVPMHIDMKYHALGLKLRKELGII